MEVVVGRIGRPHGIRGEVSVEVRTDDPEGRLAPGTTLRTDPAAAGPLTIADGRVHSGRLLLHFEGYDDRGAAEGLRNVLLVADVDPAERPDDPDEFYDHQLVGLGRAHRRPASRSASSAEVLHLPGPGRARRPPARRHRGAGAVRRGDRARASTSTRGEVVVDPPPGLLDRRTGRRRPARRDVRLDVVTIFPDYLAPLRLSLIGRAVEDGLIDLRVHDLRDWTTDRHRTVDDTPYGGGPGMLMRPEPWGDALDAVIGGAGCRPAAAAAAGARRRAVRRSPRRWRTSSRPSRGWSSPAAATRASTSGCSTRRRAAAGSTRSRLGDYVLNGGEVAVLAIVEAVARLLPGVIGNAESLVEESHAGGLLEAPGYTKPATWRGREVPAVLLSGDHARIARWRRDESLRRTAGRRPDLLDRLDPAALDRHDLAAAGRAGLGARPDGRLARVTGPVAD